MANISSEQKEKLGTALNNTTDVLRLEVLNAMFKEHGNLWDQECREALYENQITTWDAQIQQGVSPESCLDFGNVGTIMVRNKNAFKVRYGNKANDMVTWLKELREVRNKWAHGRDAFMMFSYKVHGIPMIL